MFRHTVTLLLALLVSGCGSGSDVPVTNTGADQDGAPLPTVEVVVNEDIAAFFSRFKSTVRANDPEAVANMAQFPFEMSGIDRASFLGEYYAPTFAEGDFRNRLLAASPASLQDDGDGRHSFSALVTEECGDLAEEFDCESAVVFYFEKNAEGHWRLVDMMFAG